MPCGGYMEVIDFKERIGKRTVERLVRTLRVAGAPRKVFVHSPGGEFEMFSVLGPVIERQGITTLAGDVRSAAVVLYLLGHKRLAFPDSTFFFHEVRTLVHSGEGITITNLEEVEEYSHYMYGRDREEYQDWKRQMRFAQQWFIGFISQKTGMRPDVFLNLMRSNATLDARQAVAYGIAHKVMSNISELE